MNRFIDILAKNIKRTCDFFFSLLALFILLPIFFAISLLIILDDGLPIFFVQKRIGYKNRVFNLYKFRSMKKNSEFDGTGYYCYENDFRITKSGLFLRKYSLDELPQLMNILNGKMSFVGPRPPIHDELDSENLTIKSKKFLKKRFDVIPGLTGYAQVKMRNNGDWNLKLKYDKEYISYPPIKRLLIDVVLIMKTIKEVFISKGVYDQSSN